MEYTATAKYIRHTPRKMRLVADSIRRMKALEAIRYLKLHPKKASIPMRNLKS